MRIAGLLAVIAVAALVCDQLLASSPSPGPRDPSEHRAPPGELRGPPGPADGALPRGTTVFSDGVPGIANLDPALRDALGRAATDAADEGVLLLVDSGWRSKRYQRQLLDEAVVKYGSEERAARWVASPDRSAHVSGDAVDVGPYDATAWLSRHGAEYGLCQIYDNEPWHYELRPAAGVQGCPPRYHDPTQDPRLQP
jgi:hypothetical protein